MIIHDIIRKPISLALFFLYTFATKEDTTKRGYFTESLTKFENSFTWTRGLETNQTRHAPAADIELSHQP